MRPLVVNVLPDTNTAVTTTAVTNTYRNRVLAATSPAIVQELTMFMHLESCDRWSTNPSFIPHTGSDDNGRGFFCVHEVADGLPLFFRHAFLAMPAFHGI